MRIRPLDLIVSAVAAVVAVLAVALWFAAAPDVVWFTLGAGLPAFAIPLACRLVVVELSRRRLGQSLPAASIGRVLSSGARPELEGEERTVSILYAVIEDFAPISGNPKRLVGTLNRYLAMVTPIIEAQGGFVDRVDGGTIVAVFGAPVADRHAAGAVTAAMEICRRTDREAFRLDDDRPLRLRIGVDTGTVLAGVLGPPGRAVYTVMGDVVHQAARLASASRGYETRILVSEEIATACAAEVLMREVVTGHVAGREMPLTLLKPLATQDGATAADREKASDYAAAFYYLRSGRYAEAAAAFAVFTGDPAAAALAEQAAALAAAPAPVRPDDDAGCPAT